MKLNFTQVKKDNVIRISASISLLALLALTALIFLIQSSLPPYVPLLNNMPWGTERLLSKNILLLVPGIACIMILISTIMVGGIYERNILMARILSFNMLLFTVLALLALLQIILLVL